MKLTINTLRTLTAFLALFVMPAAAQTTDTCQNNTSAGRDFWVAFLVNGGDQRPQNTRLTVFGDTACTVTFSNPLTSWSQTVNLTAHGRVTVDLPGDAIPENYSTTESKGFHITSTSDIQAVAWFTQLAAIDATGLLSTQSLGTHYLVLDYPADPGRSAVTGATAIIVATQPATTIQYTPPCPFHDSPSSVVGTPVTHVFNSAGETLLLMANEANATLSGMEITSDKPIAVFQGNQMTGVPHNSPSGDFLYEQSLPVLQWGKTFGLVPTYGRTVGDRIRVVADSACTIILSTGSSFTIADHGVNEFDLPANSPCILTADKPVSVGLCSKGSDWNAEPGDGSLLVVPAIEKGIRHADFTTLTTQRIQTWYLTVITTRPSTMTLDGNSIASQFSPIGSTGHSYARINVSSGTHSLDNSQGIFSAWTYGVGNVERYSYSLGQSLYSSIVEPIVPPEIQRDTMYLFDTICQGHAYNGNGFSIGVDETQVATTLSQMDSTVVDDTTIHYRSLTLIVLPSASEEVYKTLLPGGSIDFADTVITDTGTYVFHLTATNGCDSTLTLHVHGGDGICPNLTSAGRDFWMMFLYNYNIGGTYPQNRRLYFASTEGATVNVHNNVWGDDSFSLTGPDFSAIHSYGDNQLQVGTVFEGGYHITSSANIWLYARNFMQNTLDATVVFPTEALGTRYIVQDYPSTDNHGGEIGFVATEDSTVLSMTVPCGIQGTSITSGTTLSITLNQGQAYMLLAAQGGSLSGMEVTSNGKPFAMFHGDWNNAVPQYANARDHCYEQALPVDKWGTEFIFGSIPPQSPINHIRITASEDNTLIIRAGASNIGPLQRGQTWQGSMSNGEIWHLTSTKPIQIILYMGSFDYTGAGDPSSVTIPPLSHAICDSRFNCDRTDYIKTETHYLSIVCHEDHDSGLTLDGQPIGTRGTVTSVGNYRYRTVQVPYTTANQGFHRLQNNLGPFVAYAYGYSSTTRESYAFPLGFSFDSVIVGLQPPQTHRDTVAFSDSICQGHAYNSNGFSIGVDETQVATTLSQMDSTVVDDTTIHYRSLTLIVLPSASEEVYKTLLPGGSIDFADTVITDTGTYVFHLTAANGCDSTLTLHVQDCDVTICVEFIGRPFIDFDFPVVTLHNCSPDRRSTRWIFDDGYHINGERARRLFQQPLPDTVIVTMTTCNKDGCCADTTFGFAPKIRSVWFPNIFFPGQESNNRFGCYTSYEVVEFELEIYNRWGLFVWSTTDITTTWDGTHEGEPVPQGAYVYKWFLEDIYGDRETGVGTVTLIR